uniref:Phospholipid/glycerol acyltransferase domain-containing protein n=1 Tax=Chrysotila carterae TaxID=13221 RepID=A0A7S4F5M3_CHRCT|mmetsp:Transcript_24137/g.50632  ORF Transcript_24137/g.50632 Transcript_24137/m.50632 type:complete len:422 (+) Transcript_24137:18-1283(+)
MKAPMLRLVTMQLLSLGAQAALLSSAPATRVHSANVPRSCRSTTMIVDQLKDMVAAGGQSLKEAAAREIVEQKVAKKLADAQEKYSIPEKYITLMKSFFSSYMTEIYLNDRDMDKYEVLLTQLMKKVLETAKEPYQFEPYHKSMREPFDYYALGNDFAEGMVAREQSIIEGIEQIKKIQEQVAAGDNVVLLANHQSEADPQFFSVLLDPLVPGFAESTIFVAGDRVTTDLLAMPFSMGRNLLCIFSKKHVDNPPELKSQKTRHNRRVMKTMQELFTEGGKVVWVAPSGGRDRQDANGKYQVSPFDSKSIEMFRLMAGKAKRVTHFYPLSMFTYPICPPPQQVGGEIGEVRNVKYHPAGLYFGDEVDLSQFSEGCVGGDNFPEGCDPNASRDELREALATSVHRTVSDNYRKLADKLETFKR